MTVLVVENQALQQNIKKNMCACFPSYYFFREGEPFFILLSHGCLHHMRNCVIGCMSSRYERLQCTALTASIEKLDIKKKTLN